MNYPVIANQLDHFLAQIRTIKPLSPEREHELAVDFKENGSVEAAHQLVVSHLPFVVKTAFQYRYYMLPVQDLIQEGSIGLMKAVKRFDPVQRIPVGFFRCLVDQGVHKELYSQDMEPCQIRDHSGSA